MLISPGGCTRTGNPPTTIPPEAEKHFAVPLPPPRFEDRVGDRAFLQARAERWVRPSDANLPPEERLLEAVAVLTFRQDLKREDVEAIRAGLREIRGTLSEPYQEQLANLYLLVPATPFGFGMSLALDAQELINLRSRPELLQRIPDRQYLLETEGLLEAAKAAVVRIPSQATIEEQEARSANFKPSPLFEEIFKREGAPPEIERRARVALAEIVSGMRSKMERLRANSPRGIDPAEMFEVLHRYLKEEYGVQDAVQPSIAAGLATRTFDCDVYTLVLVEFGRQVKIPIEALYVIDPTQEKSVGHCLPALITRRDNERSFFAFEMREPIERLPDGSERRVYRGFQEMIDRINHLAGEPVLGEGAIVCRFSDRAKVSLLHPYGKQEEASIGAKDIEVLHDKLLKGQTTGSEAP